LSTLSVPDDRRRTLAGGGSGSGSGGGRSRSNASTQSSDGHWSDVSRDEHLSSRDSKDYDDDNDNDNDNEAKNARRGLRKFRDKKIPSNTSTGDNGI